MTYNNDDLFMCAATGSVDTAEFWNDQITEEEKRLNNITDFSDYIKNGDFVEVQDDLDGGWEEI